MITEDMKKIAQKSRMRFRLAAIIVDNDEIVHMGYNRPFVSRKMAAKGYYSTHAEIDALHKIHNEGFHPISPKLAIVVIRIKKDGTFGNAKPCHRCMAAIWKAGLRKVYYTGDDGQIRAIELTRKP